MFLGQQAYTTNQCCVQTGEMGEARSNGLMDQHAASVGEPQ